MLVGFLNGWSRRIFTLALRLRGHCEEAQDILQETMLKLFGKISDFPDDSPFWGWLRQIAVNESLTRIRNRHTGHEIDLSVKSGFREADILLHRNHLQA